MEPSVKSRLSSTWDTLLKEYAPSAVSEAAPRWALARKDLEENEDGFGACVGAPRGKQALKRAQPGKYIMGEI